MSHNNLDRKDYWRALILDLNMPDADTQDYLAILAQVQPTHGIRAAIIDNLPDVISERAPSARAPFNAYASALPKIPFFSFMPVIEIGVRFAKARVLVASQDSLHDACNDFTCASVRFLSRAPFMQAAFIAAEGDVRAFFRSFAGESHTIENFGSREVDIDTPNRFRLLYRDHNTRFGAYYARGAMQGNCNWFRLQAEVSFEPLDDTDFFVDVRW